MGVPRPLSLFEDGRLVTFEEDVLGVKKQIEERWEELECAFDKVDLVWCVIEHCTDGVDRLVFSTKTLDGRAIRRLEKADGHAPGARDFLDEIDEYNEEVERDRDRRFSDQIGDFGERFVHALKKDGIYDHMNIYGTRNK